MKEKITKIRNGLSVNLLLVLIILFGTIPAISQTGNDPGGGAKDTRTITLSVVDSRNSDIISNATCVLKVRRTGSSDTYNGVWKGNSYQFTDVNTGGFDAGRFYFSITSSDYQPFKTTGFDSPTVFGGDGYSSSYTKSLSPNVQNTTLKIVDAETDRGVAGAKVGLLRNTVPKVSINNVTSNASGIVSFSAVPYSIDVSNRLSYQLTVQKTNYNTLNATIYLDKNGKFYTTSTGIDEYKAELTRPQVTIASSANYKITTGADLALNDATVTLNNISDVTQVLFTASVSGNNYSFPNKVSVNEDGYWLTVKKSGYVVFQQKIYALVENLGNMIGKLTTDVDGLIPVSPVVMTPYIVKIKFNEYISKTIKPNLTTLAVVDGSNNLVSTLKWNNTNQNYINPANEGIPVGTGYKLRIESTKAAGYYFYSTALFSITGVSTNGTPIASEAEYDNLVQSGIIYSQDPFDPANKEILTNASVKIKFNNGTVESTYITNDKGEYYFTTDEILPGNSTLSITHVGHKELLSDSYNISNTIPVKNIDYTIQKQPRIYGNITNVLYNAQGGPYGPKIPQSPVLLHLKDLVNAGKEYDLQFNNPANAQWNGDYAIYTFEDTQNPLSLPGGVYDITASISGYKNNKVAAKDLIGYDVLHNIGMEPYIIKGKLIDKYMPDNLLIAGKEVKLYNGNNLVATTTTANDGSFIFVPVAGDNVVIEISGYIYKKINITDDITTGLVYFNVDDAVNTTNNIEITPKQLKINVSDLVLGNNIENAQITLTNSNGAYDVNNYATPFNGYTVPMNTDAEGNVIISPIDGNGWELAITKNTVPTYDTYTESPINIEGLTEDANAIEKNIILSSASYITGNIGVNLQLIDPTAGLLKNNVVQIAEITPEQVSDYIYEPVTIEITDKNGYVWTTKTVKELIEYKDHTGKVIISLKPGQYLVYSENGHYPATGEAELNVNEAKLGLQPIKNMPIVIAGVGQSKSVDLILDPVYIEGNVLSFHGAEPVGDVNVTAYIPNYLNPEFSRVVKTDSEGKFRVNMLKVAEPAGIDYDIVFDRTDFVTNTQYTAKALADFEQGAVGAQKIMPTSGAVISPNPYYPFTQHVVLTPNALVGWVYAADEGQTTDTRVSGVTVSVYTGSQGNYTFIKSDITNIKGQFNINGLPKDVPLTVVINKDKFNYNVFDKNEDGTPIILAINKYLEYSWPIYSTKFEITVLKENAQPVIDEEVDVNSGTYGQLIMPSTDIEGKTFASSVLSGLYDIVFDAELYKNYKYYSDNYEIRDGRDWQDDLSAIGNYLNQYTIQLEPTCLQIAIYKRGSQTELVTDVKVSTILKGNEVIATAVANEPGKYEFLGTLERGDLNTAADYNISFEKTGNYMPNGSILASVGSDPDCVVMNYEIYYNVLTIDFIDALITTQIASTDEVTVNLINKADPSITYSIVKPVNQQWILEQIPEGEYLLTISDIKGYLNYNLLDEIERTITVTGSDANKFDCILTPIIVEVTTLFNGVGVENVEITFNTDPIISETTDIDGNVIFERFAKGTYDITAQKEGYITVTLSDSEVVNTDNINNKFVIEFTEQTEINARVFYKDHAGKEIDVTQASVLFWSNPNFSEKYYYLTEESNGHYGVKGIESGVWTIQIGKEGFDPYIFNVNGVRTSKYEVSNLTNDLNKTIEIELLPYKITGSFADIFTNEAIHGTANQSGVYMYNGYFKSSTGEQYPIVYHNEEQTFTVLPIAKESNLTLVLESNTYNDLSSKPVHWYKNDGYVNNYDITSVTVDTPLDLGIITWEPTAWIVGHVYNDNTPGKDPIDNASLKLKWLNGSTEKVNENPTQVKSGNYYFSPVQSGNTYNDGVRYTIEAIAPGYGEHLSQAFIADSNENLQDLWLLPNEFNGVVTDATTNLPLENTEVRLFLVTDGIESEQPVETVFTNNLGKYIFEKVIKGNEYIIKFWSTGYVRSEIANINVPVSGPNAVVKNIALEQITLKVNLVNAATKAPIEDNLSVILNVTSKSNVPSVTTQTSSAQFAIVSASADMPEGFNTVTVTPGSKYITKTQQIQVADQTINEVTIELIPSQSVFVYVNEIVLDSQDPTDPSKDTYVPISNEKGAKVKIEGENISAEFDVVDGKTLIYTLPNGELLPDGEYTITVDGLYNYGYNKFVQTGIKVYDTQASSENFSPVVADLKDIQFRGTITFNAGGVQPLANATISLWRSEISQDEPADYVVTTDENGEYMFRILPNMYQDIELPGSIYNYNMRVQAEGFLTQTYIPNVYKNDNTLNYKNFEMIVTGIVVELKDENIPVSGVKIVVENSKNSYTKTTNKEGRVAFHELQEGIYSIVINNADGYANYTKENVYVDAAHQTQVDLFHRLEMATQALVVNGKISGYITSDFADIKVRMTNGGNTDKELDIRATANEGIAEYSANRMSYIPNADYTFTFVQKNGYCYYEASKQATINPEIRVIDIDEIMLTPIEYTVKIEGLQESDKANATVNIVNKVDDTRNYTFVYDENTASYSAQYVYAGDYYLTIKLGGYKTINQEITVVSDIPADNNKTFTIETIDVRGVVNSSNPEFANLDGVKIELLSTEYKAYSEAGLYEITKVNQGNYTINASLREFVSSSANISVTDLDDVTANFTLDPISLQISIKSWFDNQLFINIEGAKITLLGTNPENVYEGIGYTDNGNGTYNFGKIAADTYTVSLEKPGYWFDAAQLTIEEIPTLQTAEYIMNMVKISGLVQGSNPKNADLKPLEKAEIKFIPQDNNMSESTWKTNVDGTFEAWGVAIGLYTVEISIDGYNTATIENYEITNSGINTLNTVLTPVTISGYVAAMIEGVKTNVASVEVIMNGFANVITDENGAFMYYPVPDGNYTLSVHHSGYNAKSVDCNIYRNNITELEILMNPIVLSGTITCSNSTIHESGKPVIGAIIEVINDVNGFKQTVVTDENGHYSIYPTPASVTYRINITGNPVGFVNRTITAVVVNDQDTNNVKDITLTPITVTGKVIDGLTDFGGIGEIEVTLINELTGEKLTVETANSGSTKGNFIFEEIPVGLYTVTVKHEGYRDVVRPNFEVVNSSSNVIGNLVMVPILATGYVIDITKADTERGIEGAEVTLTNETTGKQYSGITIEGGSYNIYYVAEGNYKYEVRKDTYLTSTATREVNQTINNTLTIELNKVKVSGKVTGIAGNPLSNVSVQMTGGYKTTTDKNGLYSITDIKYLDSNYENNNEYTLTLIVADGSYFCDPKVITIDAMNNTGNIHNFEMTSVSVIGTITGHDTNLGIEGVNVKVGNIIRTTAVDGTFEINNIVPGVYDYELTHDQYVSTKGKVTVDKQVGNETNFNRELTPVKYEVRLQSNGNPLEGSVKLVSINNGGKYNYEAQSVNGIVKFDRVAHANYNLTAHAEGFRLIEKTVTVADKSDNIENVVFAPITVSGTITSDNSLPLIGLKVTLGNLTARVNVSNGTFNFDGQVVESGDYQLTVKAQGHKDYVATVNITENNNNIFNVEMIAITYNINASTLTVTGNGNGGTITPSGNVTVVYSKAQKFEITPSTGYNISDLKVNGVSEGIRTNYTFTDVKAESSIVAEFSIKQLQVIASSNNGGSLDIATFTNVNYGSDLTIKITPETNYVIKDVRVDGLSVLNEVNNNTYVLKNITSNHSINVTFERKIHQINVISHTGGTISPNGVVSVANGDDMMFAIMPNTGYKVSDVKIDNISKGAITNYIFENVTDEHTIEATFAQQQFVITATADVNGTITPSGEKIVNFGENATYNITANAGYIISNVIVDGISVGKINTYTFSDIRSEHSINVTFEAIIYNITATAGANGTITPSGVVEAAYGSSKTFAIVANQGYHVSEVKVNGISKGAITSYEFANVSSNATISAEFTINTYSITATAGLGGTITPSGTTTVNYGTTQAYTIKADAHYSIESVLVDGIDKTSSVVSGTYKFENVTADHSIVVSFKADTHTITATAGANGTITPSGTMTVSHGASQTFAITANTGYSISDVKVNGSSVGAVSSYTFNNIESNVTISAEFAINTYSITATAGLGGTITPSGTATVNYGATQSYTITADAHYTVASVMVDGVDKTSSVAGGIYKFENVTANHSIVVSFKADTHTITATAGANGTITPSGTMTVSHGASQTFAITANTGYSISDVKVNGSSVGAVSSYTFNNIESNVTINAEFKVATFTITVITGNNGSVTPDDEVIVEYGKSKSFVITPDKNYHISNVLLDNKTITLKDDEKEGFTYVLQNVTGNHTLSVMFDYNVGIDNAESEDWTVKVYPNPVTTGKLFVEGEYTKLSILDTSGRIIISSNEKVDYIDMSQLTQGVYIIRIENNDNVKTEKVIVK